MPVAGESSISKLIELLQKFDWQFYHNNIMADIDKRAGEVADCKKASLDWMDSNFYEQWTEVWKSYHCEKDPEKNECGDIDETVSAVGSPLTFSHIQRSVARGTAQIPNISFHAQDPDIAELISRTLMYQWDKGGVQRLQKKHFRQAAMFGWSVRAWYWAVDDFQRRKRVNPLPKGAPLDPVTIDQIITTYNLPPQLAQAPPPLQAMAFGKLLEKYGRSNFLPVEYTYTSYIGPKCDYLFVGDCYPEPNFQTLQTAGYFIVERRRSRAWINQVARDIPQFSAGFEKLLSDKPKGDPKRYIGNNQEGKTLRKRFETAISRDAKEQNLSDRELQRPEWIITEMWVPGARPKLIMCGEELHYIGEIDSVYDLDGKIPFTDAILIDDLLCGVGNSSARVMRGIQQLHERQMNQRTDLVNNILRPLVGTTNYELWDNPGLVKKGRGMRLVMMRGPGDMWIQSEQAAMAAVATGLQDEEGLLRIWQAGTGDSNMSMNANVDPAQNRTATGARLQAYTQDVLTKDLVDMFTWSSLNCDAEMMYLLNRSEMSEPMTFEAGRYNRKYTQGQEAQTAKWVTVEPVMFQVDGEIVVQTGSTLADDDESNVAKAQNLYAMFNGHPGINQDKLRDEILIAFGKGKELQQWAAQPPQPPPQEFKQSSSLSIKWEMLGESEKEFFRQKMGMVQPEMQGGPPPGPGMPGPPQPPMPPQPPQPGIGTSSLAAAQGNSPFKAGMPPQ